MKPEDIHYWRKEYFETLETLKKEAEKVPEWEKFSQFCNNMKKGLRKQSLIVLDKFIEETKDWDFEQKRQFLKWIEEKLESRPKSKYYFSTFSLLTKFIKPALEEWKVLEPENYIPFKLSGFFSSSDDRENLKKSLDLNPDDDFTRKELIDKLLGALDFATHHLPDFYCGETPEEDLKETTEVEKFIDKFVNENTKKQLLEDLNDYRKLIDKWIKEDRY